MRCLNCGWDNTESQERCEKCKHKLSIVSQNVSKPINNDLQNEAKLEKLNDNKLDQIIEISDLIVACSYPDCQYQFSSSSKICPSCKREIISYQNNLVEPIEVNQIVETIDPYNFMKKVENSSCKLKGMSPSVTGGQININFFATDGPISLNKEKLQIPYEIYTDVDAELFFDNGEWFLKVNSNPEKERIFIELKGKHQLKEGDSFKIGKTFFSFSTNK